MSHLYFWNGEEPICIEQKIMVLDEIRRNYLDMPCIDLVCNKPELRYGVFTTTGWESRELTAFPPAFQAFALLVA